MIVSLYTSRVILQYLGVEDFGIYNLVGGVVVMIAFLSNALNASCTRFLSIAVGGNDAEDIQSCFSAALVIHMLFCILLVIVFEAAGVWIIRDIINIPAGKETATMWVYQCAILTTIATILRTPFNASVIANERMSFFAWSSVAEAVLKLLVVYLLRYIPFDNLIEFAFLSASVSILITLLYIIYTSMNFKGNSLIFRCDKHYLRKMLSFGFWNVFIGAADMGWQQGTSIILNMFYGVALNATMGITNQVRTAFYSLVSNLQTAVNPQIIKSYSLQENERCQSLLFAISKYSFLLIFLFAVPLWVNLQLILNFWLGADNTPAYSHEFISLTVAFTLLDCLIGPLWTINQAHGKIKFYSIGVSIILLLNLPATYLLFQWEMPPASMLWARIGIVLISFAFQLVYTRIKTGIHIKDYFTKIIIPIVSIAITTTIPVIFISNFFVGVARMLISISSFVPLFMITVFMIGMNKTERHYIINFIHTHKQSFQ